MKNYISAVLFLIILTSCNQNEKNVLQTQHIDAYLIIPSENKDNSINYNTEPIIKTLKGKTQDINKNIYSAKFIDWGNHLWYPDYKQYKNNTDVLYKSTGKESEMLQNMKSIYFHEQWFLDDGITSFSKVVKAWYPAFQIVKNNKIKTRTPMSIIPDNDLKGSLLNNKVYTEVYLLHYGERIPMVLGMNYSHFFKTVINKIKDGSLKAYDPIYFVDGTKKQFSIYDIQEYINKDLADTMQVNNNGQYETVLVSKYTLDQYDVTSLVFEEDWYFNKETLNIHKEVKALGFGAYFENQPMKPSTEKLDLLFVLVFD